MAANERLLAFSNELLRWYRQRGLTQQGLADLLETNEQIVVTASAVGEWCRGESEPTRDKVFALERVLGTAAGDLSRTLGYEPPNVVTGTASLSVGGLEMSADGRDLDELRETDPEGFEALMVQARILLKRNRDRLGG